MNCYRIFARLFCCWWENATWSRPLQLCCLRIVIVVPRGHWFIHWRVHVEGISIANHRLDVVQRLSRWGSLNALIHSNCLVLPIWIRLVKICLMSRPKIWQISSMSHLAVWHSFEGVILRKFAKLDSISRATCPWNTPLTWLLILMRLYYYICGLVQALTSIVAMKWIICFVVEWGVSWQVFALVE